MVALSEKGFTLAQSRRDRGNYHTSPTQLGKTADILLMEGEET